MFGTPGHAAEPRRPHSQSRLEAPLVSPRSDPVVRFVKHLLLIDTVGVLVLAIMALVVFMVMAATIG